MPHKKEYWKERLVVFGRSYCHCSVLFLNTVATDLFSLLIAQELNYRVSPYNRALELSATSSLQHHCTRQVIIVQKLCKWADTSNCLWTQHWAQASNVMLPLNWRLLLCLKFKPGLKCFTGLSYGAQNQALYWLNANTPEISMQCFIYLSLLLKRVTGNKLCLHFPNIQVPSRNQSWVL